MMPRSAEHPCEEFQLELTRLACGDAVEPTPAFRTHLSHCATCRAALADTRHLVQDLRIALRPSEIPSSLLSTVEVRLITTRARRRGRMLSLVVPCAVAASLALTLLIPFRLHLSGDSPPARSSALGVDDTAWDSPAGYSLKALTADRDELDATQELAGDEWTLLPWGSEDDWDRPSRDSGAVQNEG